MAQEKPPQKLRVALAAFPSHYALPGRPAAGSPALQDAHRQTHFLLAADLALLERAMNLQLAIIAANAKVRSPQAAALLSLWSRIFSGLADTCVLLYRASYVSCPPLLRTACDCIAAQRSLLADDFADYLEWFQDAVQQDREHAALAFALGRFRAGSILAQDQRLGSLYRLLTDLCMPHFGATVLQIAPDSTLQKLALTFADGAFHLAWAELTSGWLLALAGAQLNTVIGSGVFAVNDSARQEHERWSGEAGAALASPRRCRAEEVDGRFLFHNFRRTAGGGPKRVAL